MSEIKCPLCQQELLLSSFRDGDKDNEIWNCLHCQIGGKRKLWQELIRTRKALDVAKDTFNWIDKTYQTGQEMEAEIWGKVQLAAQEITALEQKDVK